MIFTIDSDEPPPDKRVFDKSETYSYKLLKEDYI